MALSAEWRRLPGRIAWRRAGAPARRESTWLRQTGALAYRHERFRIRPRPRIARIKSCTRIDTGLAGHCLGDLVPDEPFEASAIRAALREIVAEYGTEALFNAKIMANLVKDLLPDSPHVARMLVVAAEEDVGTRLRDHVAQSVDVATAISLCVSTFASSTMFAPAACAVIVGELASALGLGPADGLARLEKVPIADPMRAPTTPADAVLAQTATAATAEEFAAATTHAAGNGPLDHQPEMALSDVGMVSGIPAMPEFFPRELDEGHGLPQVLAPNSGKHFIGWQSGAAADGGATFVVGRVSGFNKLTVIQRFSLTQVGWVHAWQALLSVDQGAAKRAPVMLEARAAEHAKAKLKHRAEAAIVGQPARAPRQSPDPGARPRVSLTDELDKLASMLESGLLTRAEFDQLKAKLIAGAL